MLEIRFNDGTEKCCMQLLIKWNLERVGGFQYIAIKIGDAPQLILTFCKAIDRGK